MNSNIKNALECLENADYSGYFEEMDKITPRKLGNRFSELRMQFIAGDTNYKFASQLKEFARLVDKELGINNHKIEKKINVEIKIDTPFALFDEQSKEAFLKSLSELLNISQVEIKILSCTKGSVILIVEMSLESYNKLKSQSPNILKSLKIIDVHEKTKKATTILHNETINSDKIPQKILIVIAVIFLIISITYVFIRPCPTEMEHLTFRILLAISGGIFGGSIAGTFIVKYKNIATATGGLAAFLLILSFNTGQLLNYRICNDKLIVKGLVFIDTKLTEGINISLPQLEKQRATNRDGKYEFETNSLELKQEIIFKFNGNLDSINLDTIIRINKDSIKDWTNLNFYLFSKKNVITPNISTKKPRVPKEILFKLQGRLLGKEVKGKIVSIIIQNSTHHLIVDDDGYFRYEFKATNKELKLEVKIGELDKGKRLFISGETTDIKL